MNLDVAETQNARMDTATVTIIIIPTMAMVDAAMAHEDVVTRAVVDEDVEAGQLGAEL